MADDYGQSLQGTMADMDSAEQDPSGGATAAPNPVTQNDMAALNARVPAQPDAAGGGGMPVGSPEATPPGALPTTMPGAPGLPALNSSPFAPPPGVSALSHPHSDPLHHMSFGTVLQLALSPFAPQLVQHIQDVKHQHALEDIKNREFNETLKQHAAQAQDHADMVKQQQAAFEAKLGEMGATAKPADYQPPPGDPHQVLHIGDKSWVMPTAQERRDREAADIKAKTTASKGELVKTTINGKDYMLEPQQAAAIEAQRQARTDAMTEKQKEDAEHEKDRAASLTEKQGEFKQREADAQERRAAAHQALQEKHQQLVSTHMDKLDTMTSGAKAAYQRWQDSNGDLENARQELAQAKAAAEEAAKGGDAAVQKQTAKDRDAAAMKEAKINTSTQSLWQRQQEAWGKARGQHTYMQHAFAKDLEFGGTGKDEEPTAAWRAGSEPGAEATQAPAAPADSAAPQQPAAAAAPKTADPAEYAQAVKQFGQAKADAWMKQNGWTLPNAAGPAMTQQPAQQ